MDRKKLCRLLLSVGLIAAGLAFGWFLLSIFLIDTSAWYLTGLTLLLCLPLGCILPVYAGVACLIETFKKESEENGQS